MKKRFYIALLMMVSAVSSVFSQSKTITGGNDHGLIICAQGYLYTWGNNMSKVIGGPLLGIDPGDPETGGNANKDYVTVPSRVKSGNLTFSQVTAGSGAFNLALACNTVVYAWGENTNGGCGQGPSGDNVIKYPVPVLKGETPGYDENGNLGGKYLGGVTYIAASTNSGFAIMDDGRVVGWGGGTWNSSSNTTSPVYIKDKSGNDITNVTHISGGDDNCLIRTADGLLYGIGPWNGQRETALKYAAQVLKDEDGTPLTDIRMSAAGDVCGFAVTGDGYVWAWGNGGWGGSTGQAQSGANHAMARKVSSGEYATISGEEYLTDVKEVIGGRGHGAAVTKEGYLVYWGCDEGNGGVAPANISTSSEYRSGAQGVKPILAHYCDASGKPGPVVDNAVSISRGDNFDFMMNDEDKYYVWGLNDLGQCGVGTTVSKYNCLVELKTIPCDIQDNCPEVFMVDQVKCPGEEIELDCGFVVPKGKENRYFIEWFYNGKSLNKSKKTDNDATRKSDPFNVASIKITEPGTYGVLVEYIGNNIPCDKCKPAETEITVTDMDMPIDTVITNMNCVADPLKPSSTDNICFEAEVNNKFYKAKDKVTFAAFSTETGVKDTLKDADGNSIVIETTGAGGEIKFCVSGDQIKTVVNNSTEESKDTIYNVWLEDISSFETILRKGEPGASAQGGSFQSYGMLLDMYASADLKSFDFYAKSYSGSTSMTVTPIIYSATKNDNGIYVVGAEFARGKAQSFDVDDSGPNKCTVKCNINIPGSSTRGVRYILGMTFAGNVNAQIYEVAVPATKQNSPEYVTPIIDSEEFGIYEMGATANSYTTQSNGAQKTCYYNVTFGKLTDYDCGRILLSARYGCPPCDRPDATGSKYVTITTDAETNSDGDIEICKGADDVILNIEPLKFEGSAAVKKFDILWFDNEADLGKEAKAKVKDNAASLSYTADSWEDIIGTSTESVSKTYYVMVRDHEKPESADCYVFDSIHVIAHPQPTEELDPIEFCKGSLDTDPAFTYDNGKTLTGKTIKWVTEPTDIKDMEASADFKYTIVDDETGCEGEEHTLTITVNTIDNPDVQTSVSQLKTPGATYSLSSAVLGTYSAPEVVRWYETETSTTPLTTAAAKVSLDNETTEGQPIERWVDLYNEETQCVSERIKVEITINSAPQPETNNEHLCVGDAAVNMASYVTPLNTTDYEILWYESATANKDEDGSTTAPTFTPGETAEVKEFYVSQKNVNTGAVSEIKTFTVTVHKVATVNLTDNKLSYCKGDTPEELKYTPNTNGDFTTAMWSQVYDETTKTLSNGKETAAPSTTSATETTDQRWYIMPQYANKLTINGSAICYGTAQHIDITVNETLPPEGTLQVSYVKSEGEATGSYQPVLTQDPDAVLKCSTCNLYWFKDQAMTQPISEPAPTYDANLVDDVTERYWVMQKNTATTCASTPVEVVVTVSGFPTPKVNPAAFCEKSTKFSGFKLSSLVTKVPTPTTTVNDIDLKFYYQNPKTNATAGAYNDIDLGSLDEVPETGTAKSLDIKLDSDGKPTEMEHVYTFYVTQRFDNDASKESAPALIKITIYALPRLKTNTPDPVCLGESVDLTENYDVSNDVKFSVIAEYENGVTESDAKNIKVHGNYDVRGKFPVSSATDAEVCYSTWETIAVTVHELAMSINPITTTCPNEAVTLDADVTTKNVDAADIKYQWSTSANVTGSGTTFNTTTAGLEATGKQLNTTLKVTAGACEESDAIVTTVGDGPVNGTITFTEAKNSNSGESIAASVNGGQFSSCGDAVTVTLEVDNTETEFTYTSDKGDSGSGSFSGKKATITAKPGTYTVSYTNKCPTNLKFTIVDVSVSVDKTPNGEWDICENQSTYMQVDIKKQTPSEKCTIEWFKDNVSVKAGEVSGTTDKYEITGADPDTHSGVYTYKLMSGGCVTEGKVSLGLPLLVKPLIQLGNVTESYEVIRTKDVTMTIPFVVPADPATISDEILWTENGNTVSYGDVYSISSVDKDHKYVVDINPDGYCGTTQNVTLNVDALLTLSAYLDENKLSVDMCVGENHTLYVDTTGTGKILHPDQLTLKLEETKGGTTTTKTLVKNMGKLSVTVSPDADATYKVVYTYGAQDETKEDIKLIVHPAVDVQWAPTNLSLCEGTSSEIGITKAEPAEDIEELEWAYDPDIVNSGKWGAQIEASFTGEGTSQIKRYKLTARHKYCQPKEYYPSVTVYKQMEGEITGPEYSCQDYDAVLDATSFGAESYTWRSPDQFGDETMMGGKITVKPKPEYAEYICEMKRGACTTQASHAIVVTYAPVVDKVDSLDYRSVEIVLESGTGTAPFEFVVDGDKNAEDVASAVKEDLSYGRHEVVITDAAGCRIEYSFKIDAPQLTFPIHISPNGDGVNDVFRVPTLSDAYPNAIVRIYDRWGKKVSETKAGDTEKDWDGSYNGVNMPSTDYWYEIEIEEIEKIYTGHFTLIRQ